MMPFAYSIAEGIVFSMLAYTIIKLLAGKTKDVSITMYVLSVIFLIRMFVM
jgi:AGZA family xanthine/uracil permease-like MFS transporter